MNKVILVIFSLITITLISSKQTNEFLELELLEQTQDQEDQSTPTSENTEFKLFQQFLKDFEVAYNSSDELLHRFKVFQQNMKISKNNYNQFSDLTPEEFAQQYLTLKTNQTPITDTLLQIDPFQEVPESFDWRDHKAVTLVKSQGQCGSCWAFSATANIESLLAIKTGSLTTLSEQQIVDCDAIDHGCGGGWQEKAFQYIQQQGGLEADKDYVYTHSKSTCKFDAAKVVTGIKGFKFVDTDEELLKAALVQNGPLAAALNAQMLQYYFGGVFHVKWPFTCDPKLLNHAVLIVGYGETSEGQKYWVVKNSWGGLWGEKGYFRILRGSGECGINTHVLTAELED